MFERIEEFERGGSKYTLYRGGSFTLFREEDDGATGVGTIEQVDGGFEVACWWRPETRPTVGTLSEAVEALLELSDAGG